MSENLPHHTPAATPMAATEWEGLAAPFPALVYREYLGQRWIECPAPVVVDLLRWLREDQQFDTLSDLTAVDYKDHIEIVYILYSFAKNERIRVKLRAAEEVPTATSVFPGANWLEREAYDMFGIPFAGHPNLKRILMPEDWDGFPLRKDRSITAMDNDWVQRNLGIESGQS